MPRMLGSGTMGSVRSLRLPRALDRWFEERLREQPSRAASGLLLELIVGGLRLRPGYLARHVATLCGLRDDVRAYAAYLDVLRQTFGDGYVLHVESAIVARVPVDNNPR